MMNLFCDDNVEGIKISTRDTPPADYIFQIQSFSFLAKNSIERYDSADFESGGHKWRLSLYPNGNKNKKGIDHISLYLVIAETDSLPTGWEVNVIIRFCLLDQKLNKYVVIEGSEERLKRFNGLKTELGFSQMIPLTTFKDPCNGYLVDDTCMFGVEVFVHRSSGNGECLSVIKDATAVKHTWKVDNFSQLTAEFLFSDVFTAGDQKWKVKLEPKGTGKNNNLSLYLVWDSNEADTTVEKLYVDYKLLVRDQKSSKHYELPTTHWFSSSERGWGWKQFLGLLRFENPANGFLVNDTCIIDAEVTVLAVVKRFT